MLATSAVASARQRAPVVAAPRDTARARYFLHVTLGGGIDTVLSFDPKQQNEVAPKVDVPAPKSIVSVGNVRIGPLVRELSPWVKRMTLVRGVNMSTVAHQPGFAQAMCAKIGRAAGQVHVPLAEIIGTQRDTQAVSAITLGDTIETLATRELSQDTLRTLLALEPEELAACTSVVQAQRSELAAGASRGSIAVGALDDTLELMKRLSSVPKPDLSVDWSGVGATDYSEAFQFALWIFENDLAKSVRLFFDRWDTHVDNLDEQTKHSGEFFPAMARFLREMETRRNSHGVLLDNTLMLMGSELGRFPEINSLKGKHHFPEAPQVLMGPGIEPGRVVGETAKRMEAMPIDLRTGRPTKGGTKVNLDDIGASVVAAAGLEPKQFGYHGRVLGVVH